MEEVGHYRAGGREWGVVMVVVVVIVFGVTSNLDLFLNSLVTLLPVC